MMKTMKIGEDLIFLNHVTDINCTADETADTGVILTITTANTEKEYLIPDEKYPEQVIAAIQYKIEEQHNFDLLRSLRSLHRMHGDD